MNGKLLGQAREILRKSLRQEARLQDARRKRRGKNLKRQGAKVRQGIADFLCLVPDGQVA
jgi:Tfp pilus assembly protein FimV